MTEVSDGDLITVLVHFIQLLHGSGSRKVMNHRIRNQYIVCSLLTGLLAGTVLPGCGKQEEVVDAGPVYETAVRMNVENLYTAKGKIISGQESSMNVQGAGTQDSLIIDEVYVSVGDIVSAGDVLYTIDTTQTERDLALKEQQQALADQENALTQSANQRALADAQAASGEQYVTGTRNLQRNADDTNKAIVNQLEDQSKLQSYKDEETRTKAAYDTLQAQADSLQADLDEKQSRFNELSRQLSLKQMDASQTASAAGTLSQELIDLQKEVSKAQWSYEDAATALSKVESSLTEAKAAYETAKSNRESYEKTVKSDEQSTTEDVRRLEDSGVTVNKDNRSVLSDEAAQRTAIASQEIKHATDTLTSEAEIAKLREKLENGQVIATMDGTVTAVNVVAGQSYNGSDGVVLDNLSQMKVSADIDEGHIADLKVGTRVRVKTDSTGSDELMGTVTFTSPTPTKETSNTTTGTTSGSSGNSQNTKTRATYKVEMTLDEPNDRLRMGMTATIDFVVASAENAVAIPSGCLISDGAGNYFVNVLSSDEAAAADENAVPQTTEVMVTIGVSDGYYTEITSGNIREGDQIQSSTAADTGDYSGMLDGIY